MSIKSEDPRKIHDGYKEAVVDSLLNNLAARVSGRDGYYKIIYGAKPSKTLLSEFILPMPEGEREGDEEADPIQISAHGLDFQIRTDASDEKMLVRLSGSVYVRVVPTADEVASGGVLEVSFPLKREVGRELRDRVRSSLKKLEEELGGQTHADWRLKSLEARAAAYASMGLQFDKARDRTTTEDVESENGTGSDEEAKGTTVAQSVPDGLAEDVPSPAKWIRLDLDLPAFEFSASTAADDARSATEALNAAIAAQLSA